MTLSKRTRQLVVLCGLQAAWQGNTAQAMPILEALGDLVPDDQVREQCEDIFTVLLDNRRLTQPSYDTCDALLTVLSPVQESTPSPFNETVTRNM